MKTINLSGLAPLGSSHPQNMTSNHSSLNRKDRHLKLRGSGYQENSSIHRWGAEKPEGHKGLVLAPNAKSQRTPQGF